MANHIEVRRKLLSICEKKDFDDILDRCTLSLEEKEILYLHYIDKQDFSFIADTLGYSESTVKRRHRNALGKISRVI